MVRADCLVLRHGAEAQRESSGGQGGSGMLVKAEWRMVEAGDWVDRGGDRFAVQRGSIFFKSCLLIPGSLEVIWQFFFFRTTSTGCW